MPEEPRPTGRGASTTIARTTARRAVRSGVIWGALFGLLVLNEALSYDASFPTAESRRVFAEAFGDNPGLAAVTGSGRQLDTLEGFLAWRTPGLLIIVGAVWGLLLATRALRGEEDAGRWELLLAGRTSRRHATVQGLAGLGAGFAALWGLTAALTVAAGANPKVNLSVSASLFYATAVTASAAVFLAVGALTGQLAPTRRQANGLGAAVLGVSLLVRMVADAVDGLDWLRWAGPLGWVENLRPLTEPQPLALVPLVMLIGAAAAGAVVIAGHRDVGAALLARHEAAESSSRLLAGPASLAIRLERWVALAWIAGLAALALVFGVVARTAAEADIGDDAIEQAVGRLGAETSGAAAWIGYEFLYVAALVAFAAANQISAMRSEEADGHLDHLLTRPVTRQAWLAGRLAVAGALVVLAGLAAGLGGWIGLAGESAVGLGSMLTAGINLMAPGIFVLGLGTLLYGVVPRWAVAILNVVVLWSFVVEIIGTSITTNPWLLNAALLSHLGPVPATSLNWTAIGWMVALGLVAALGGWAAFHRRDLLSD